MTFYVILCLLANFDPKGFHTSICEAEKGSMDTIVVNIYFLDLLFAYLTLDSILFTQINVC